MTGFKDEIKKEVMDKVGAGIGAFSPENIDQLATVLGKSLKSFLHDKQEQLDDMRDQYEGKIKDHPLSSVATAFTVGILIGLLFRRG